MKRLPNLHTRRAGLGKTLGSVIAGLILSSSAIALPIVPFGPQNDVSLATITGAWGWSTLYQGDYGEFDVNISDTLAGAGDLIMLGGKLKSSSTFEVIAATTLADATTVTALNATTFSNGANWYFNTYSWGFAGDTDSINQNQADNLGTGERDRLSWHTGIEGAGYNFVLPDGVTAPIEFDGGWRAGNNTRLNRTDLWERFVFTASSDQQPVPVPVPATLALFGLGLAGLGWNRRKKA